MTTALTAVVAGIQDLVLAVTGIRTAPDSLPDTLQVFPAVAVYPAGGEIATNGAGFATELHTFNVDLYVDSGDWAKAYARGTSLLDVLYRKLIENPTLSATVQTVESVSYDPPAQVELSGIPALMWRIRINGAKIQHTWTI